MKISPQNPLTKPIGRGYNKGQKGERKTEMKRTKISRTERTERGTQMKSEDRNRIVRAFVPKMGRKSIVRKLQIAAQEVLEGPQMEVLEQDTQFQACIARAIMKFVANNDVVVAPEELANLARTIVALTIANQNRVS